MQRKYVHTRSITPRSNEEDRRDKAKAAVETKEVEWRRESNDDLIEREFEDGIKLVVGILILNHLRMLSTKLLMTTDC